MDSVGSASERLRAERPGIRLLFYSYACRILKQLLVAQLIAAAIPAWRSKIARNQAIA